jgi:curved DNA-binding protein CbpA
VPADRGVQHERVPRLVPGWEQKAADLRPEEGFLLSRIDGQTSWGMLRSISGLPPAEVDRCLQRFVSDGLVELRRAAAAGRAPERAGIDPGIDLPLELQHRILDFESQLDRPYHQILGVTRDADERAIKRAYFKLSKDFHPDRYFRREIGAFAERLDRIFKRVALAYELLIDPATRAEIERTLGAEPMLEPEPEPEQPAGAAARPRTWSKREWLEKMRRRFRIPEEVLVERRFRARQLADASRVAQHAGNWNEAASSLRLAIAFDPWTDAYKVAFGEVMSRVNELRAAKLLEEAEGARDVSAGAEALRLYEEVLAFRPGDAAVYGRAAQVALTIDDLERAREYADHACELDPQCAAHALLLARALRRLGRPDEAKQALDRASRLDPRNPEIQQELAKARARGRSRGGMR